MSKKYFYPVIFEPEEVGVSVLCSGYSRLQYSRRFFGRSFGDGAGSELADVGR